MFDSPSFHKDFDNELELRLGLLGNLIEKEQWVLDYELTADARQMDGPSVQSSLRPETDVDFFRAWLRLDNGNFKIRGGRQKILFGSGAIYRPLGFFDTRNVSGVVPQTRGVDGVRVTQFQSDTALIEGWLVPAKKNDALIVGIRGEMILDDAEVGAVFQYHPESDLDDLPGFNQEMIQMGYHIKGEKELGFWNESRLDVEMKPSSPLRFDTVLGVDYTFSIGEGLHVLAEYFLTTRQNDFTLLDAKGQRTIQQMGITLDQPVGIDIKWQVFGLYDLQDESFQLVPQIEYALTDTLFLYAHGRLGGALKTGKKDGRLFRKTDAFNGTESFVGVTLMSYFSGTLLQ
ncbi:MAG: hypothetical protein H8E42_08880 [Nitrospinae bacterium]|nr:hypothetical protein [Nitrospinota bacterium]MBL7019868.1 hypothetical protein [Nitrospinaceae bacterium]